MLKKLEVLMATEEFNYLASVINVNEKVQTDRYISSTSVLDVRYTLEDTSDDGIIWIKIYSIKGHYGKDFK